MGHPRLGGGGRMRGGQGRKFNNHGHNRRGHFQHSVQSGFIDHRNHQSRPNRDHNLQRTVINFPSGNNGTRPGTNFNTLGSSNNGVGQDGNFCDSAASTLSNTRSSGFNPFRTHTVSAVEANQRSNMTQGQQKPLLGPFSSVQGFGNSSAIQGLNPLLTEEYARRIEFGGLQRTVHQSVSVSNNGGGSSDTGTTFTDSMGVERLKKQLCKNYFGSRGCTKGMNCTFMHQDFPCWLFHVKGECSEEVSSCKFSHEELNPMKRKILVGNIVKYKDLFPRMDHKQVQEAIDRMAAKRKTAKDSGINSNVDVIVLDNDSVISEDEDSNPLVISIPSPSQESSARIDSKSCPSSPTIGVPGSASPHLRGSPIILNEIDSVISTGTLPRSKQQNPSLHEIMQRTRRIIHQHQLVRQDSTDGADKFFKKVVTSETQEKEASSLFATISKPINFKGLPERKGRAMMDAVIDSCIGHGPPYTNWQICLIYSTCAQNGLHLDL